MPEQNETAPGLRERIAAAIWERQNPGRKYADCKPPWNADAESDADTVLAVVQPVIDELDLLRRGAAERADLLEEARDALSAAGQNGAHGDDWPHIAPSIRALGERAEQAEATIARVRKLHARTEERRAFDLSLHPIPTCTGCGERWPCPTAAALTPLAPEDQTEGRGA